MTPEKPPLMSKIVLHWANSCESPLAQWQGSIPVRKPLRFLLNIPKSLSKKYLFIKN